MLLSFFAFPQCPRINVHMPLVGDLGKFTLASLAQKVMHDILFKLIMKANIKCSHDKQDISIIS